MCKSATAVERSCELADILRKYGPTFRNNHRLATPQYKAMRAIEACRTATYGGHILQCDKCGAIEQSYNSCRNRHCPKCQSLAKVKWLDARQKELLPTQYFHVVFTIPHEINLLAQYNHKLIYDLLFKSVWHAVSMLGGNPKHLGGEMGMISILHSWGQSLSQHIHLHCLIPGGALNKKWIPAKKGFLFPVKALSRIFRGYYVSKLREAYKNKLFSYDPVKFNQLQDQLMAKDWVVYSKCPFAGPQQVLDYLGRYTHKIAITNNRIISCDNGKVTFKWKDYAHGNKEKIMTIDAQEFIRRFMIHVLPIGFVRIRHFGFLANCCRSDKIETIRQLLDAKEPETTQPKDETAELMLELTGVDIALCPTCQCGKLFFTAILERQYWDTS
jgi:hypothetical protein